MDFIENEKNSISAVTTFRPCHWLVPFEELDWLDEETTTLGLYSIFNLKQICLQEEKELPFLDRIL